MNLMDALLDIMSVTDVRMSLAWMFSFAILVGGILDNKGSDVLEWVIAVTVFALFGGVASSEYMTSKGAMIGSEIMVSAFFMMTAFLYSIGLFIGWATVTMTKKYFEPKPKVILTPDELRDKGRDCVG